MSADPFANKGYKCLAAGANDLSASPIYGFTPTSDDFAVVAITHPSDVSGTKYNGDSANLPDQEFVKGVFYPFPATAIEIAGKAIGWIS